jgi:hypothetical protein
MKNMSGFKGFEIYIFYVIVEMQPSDLLTTNCFVMLQDLGTQQRVPTGPAHSVHSKTTPCWTSVRHVRCLVY